jgi:hypothetical protein
MDSNQQRDHAEEQYNDSLLYPFEELSPEEQQQVLAETCR